MNNNFPLYEQLSRLLDDDLKVLEYKDKDFITEEIKKMSEIDHEIIYVLIKTHQIKTNNVLYPIPFNGKTQKKGVKFDIDNFPLKLQHILLSFVNLHLDTKF